MKRDSILSRYFEWTDPAVALLLGLTVWWFAMSHATEVNARLTGDRTTLYGPLAGVFGALMGFVLAAFSIIVTMLSNDRLRSLRELGYDQRIWRAFRLSIHWCAAATALPVLALIFDRQNSAGTIGNSPELLGVLTAFSLAAGLSVLRCVDFLYLLGIAVAARPDAPPAQSAS